jgi:hypothetical protein
MMKTSLAAAVALVATLAAPGVLAADATEALRVVRDKETGQMRAPTRDEMKALLEAEKAERKARGLPEERAMQPVQVRTYPNGMKAAVLGEEFLVMVTAEKDANGNLVVKHANPADEHVVTKTTTELPTE